MDFREAGQKFQELEKNFTGGKITPENYRAELARLRVTDSAGAVWQMQEHTGRWFCYRDGQWVAATPPVSVSQPVKAAPPAEPPAQAPAPKRRSGKWLALVIAACLMCGVLICFLSVGGGYLLYQRGMVDLPPELVQLIDQAQNAGPADAGGAAVRPAEQLAVAADGAPHADSHGVALTVGGADLPENTPVNLIANDLKADWRKTLESGYSFDTPFYAVSVPGKENSAGGLDLSFPAASEQSRLVAVVDGDYLVQLAVTPQDGKLAVKTYAGPSDPSGLTSFQGMEGAGSIYYVVMTPKPGTGSLAGGHQASLVAQADERNCTPGFTLFGKASINLCRQDEEGTVQVLLPLAKRDLAPQVDQMVDKIVTVMKKYSELGFTAATLSKSSPLTVRISTTISSPTYYPLNGVLYIPVDTVQNIASGSPVDVYHEMAHWIQNKHYNATAAYYSQERTWWLETAAENMVMLVEPKYISGNLTTYGTITTGDTLALQNSPYQWPADFYVQAQLVKVNMCDSATCPLSAASFAKAISEGVYPFKSGANQSLLSGNLTDYAYYLLGKSPVRANTAIPLTGAVKSGDGYGEYITVSTTTKADLSYSTNGTAPQIRKEAKDGKDTLVVEAKLQRDGVYPLMVQAQAGNSAGMPVQLTISPGASFYYTLDDGELQYSNGSKELKIQPIFSGGGYKKVRIVALGINGGEVLNARVEPLDLSGAWVVFPTGKLSGSLQCTGGGEDSTTDPEGVAMLNGVLVYLASGTGDMAVDSTGRNLDWSVVSARVPAEFTEAMVTYKASALLGGGGIKYQGEIDIPRPASHRFPAGKAGAALAGVAGLALLPLIWWGRRHSLKKRLWVNLLTLAVLAVGLAGCVGIALYGTTGVEANLTKIEYVGGEDTGTVTFSNQAGAVEPQGKPMWKLSGTATYNVNFSIEVGTTDANGVDQTEVTTCTGPASGPVMVYVYKDVTVVIPKSSE